MNDIEYIENLKEIIDTYFDGSQSKFAKFIGTSSPTISRALNQTTKISNSLKETIYDRLQLIKGIPKEILLEFEPPIDDIVAEVSTFEQEEVLADNILQQIRNNRKVNLTPNNPSSLFDLYNVLYEEINRLQYSVGAISDTRMFKLLINSFLNSTRLKLTDYIINNKYAPLEIDEFLKQILPYDISNNIFDIKLEEYYENILGTKIPNRNHIVFKVLIFNNSLRPLISIGDCVSVSYISPNNIIAQNDILFCQVENIAFLAIADVLKPQQSLQHLIERKNINLIITHQTNNFSKSILIQSDSIKKYNIQIVGKIIRH
jgi:hypothetical protein